MGYEPATEINWNWIEYCDVNMLN